MISCNKSSKFTKKNYLHILFLLAAGLFLIWQLIPDGAWFGSETDWYSQHMTIADYMRKNFYATGQLFPDFTGLGGGTNFFSLSYYGFMRPDVLLSYFFPSVSVAYFLQGYAIFEILLGCTLLYFWLHQKGISDFTDLVCSFFYLCANCMFQSHRQIMFVNYLPFAIMALICLDQISSTFKMENYKIRPHAGLILSLFLFILHSFYFFPSCFVAGILYICVHLREQKEQQPDRNWKKLQKKIWWNYILDVSIAVSMTFFLLLPTGLAILGNKKDVGNSTSLFKILAVNPTLDSILYSPYGCGLTLFCLYALFLAIREKKTRKLAIAVFVLLFFDIFYWILNATLYVRPKCMIPFLPLILYLTALVLDGLRQKKIRHSLPLALLCIAAASIQLIFLIHAALVHAIIFADMMVLLILVLYEILREKKEITFSLFPAAGSILSFFLLCTTPALLYLARGHQENYAALSDNSRDYFSQEDLEKYCENPQARFDITEHPSNNTNYVISGTQNKSTLYSSISNSSYNTLLYDILKMPISIRNRVAMTADVNPFQEYLMGVRYLQTKKEKLPAGYKILQEKEGHILAENENVLPIAYGSTALMSETDFDKLSYPENLDTLMNRTVISSDSSSLPYSSQMVKYDLPEDFFSHKNKTEPSTVKKELPKTLKASTVLLLSFDVDYSGQKDISITVNGIRNRLSGSEAPYPNNNNTFNYMVSGNEDIAQLKIQFSPGEYQIKNVTAYTIPLSAFSHPGIIEFREKDTRGSQILNGTIDMPEDGYFVTSFTLCNGYKAFVDGKEVKPEQVNKAFLGFPIQKGAHEITLEFHAPGKDLGILISCLAAAFLFLSVLLHRIRHARHK